MCPHTGNDTDKVFHNGAGQFRIGSQRGVGVCRHFYLRDDLDLACSGIGDDLFHILLRIESAYRCRFSRLGVFTLGEICVTGHSPGSDFRQAGIFLYFQTPSVTIDQMQVEFVQFQHRHIVDYPDHVFFRNEKAGNIEH